MTATTFKEQLVGTNGITLNKISLDEADPLLKLLELNRDFFLGFEFVPPKHETADELTQTIMYLMDKERNMQGVAYVVYRHRQILGQFTVNEVDWTESWANIGYWLGEHSIGQGIAYNALSLLINYCVNVLQLRKIIATTAVSNISSQKLLEKVGFSKSRLIENAIYIRGKRVNDYEYILEKS